MYKADLIYSDHCTKEAVYLSSKAEKTLLFCKNPEEYGEVQNKFKK